MKRTSKGAPVPASKPGLKLVSAPVTRATQSKPKGAEIPDNCKECADELRYLLEEAESGALTGLAFVYLTDRRTYNTGFMGDCSKNTTFTIGVLDILKARLVKNVMDKANL